MWGFFGISLLMFLLVLDYGESDYRKKEQQKRAKSH
jgi:hypothetical protein